MGIEAASCCMPFLSFSFFGYGAQANNATVKALQRQLWQLVQGFQLDANGNARLRYIAPLNVKDTAFVLLPPLVFRWQVGFFCCCCYAGAMDDEHDENIRMDCAMEQMCPSIHLLLDV